MPWELEEEDERGGRARHQDLYNAELDAKIHGVDRRTLPLNNVTSAAMLLVSLELGVIAYGAETCYLGAAAYDANLGSKDEIRSPRV